MSEKKYLLTNDEVLAVYGGGVEFGLTGKIRLDDVTCDPDWLEAHEYNERTPGEYDGYFILPKPKESIIQQARCQEAGEYAVKVNIIEDAVKRWADSMEADLKQRLFETFGRRTCRIVDFSVSGSHAEDSVWELSCGHKELGDKPRYCPNCGAKVEGVEE